MSTEAPERRPGELGARELARWAWRQLTSMRTALILLLLLALAAVPGSLIPQAGVDALEVTQWKDDHPDLARIYERLGLFSVYSTPWFAAIYILLMVSLAGLFTPVFTLGLGAVPMHLYSHASSLLGTLQQVAAALGTALVVTVMSSRATQLVTSGAEPHEAMLGGLQWAFYVGAALSLLVVVLAVRLPNRLPTAAAESEPEPEPEPCEDLAA